MVDGHPCHFTRIQRSWIYKSLVMDWWPYRTSIITSIQSNFMAYYLSIYLSIYVYIYIYICLFSHLSIYLPTYLLTYLPTYLSIYPSVHLSIYPCIHLSINLCVCMCNICRLILVDWKMLTLVRKCIWIFNKTDVAHAWWFHCRQPINVIETLDDSEKTRIAKF